VVVAHENLNELKSELKKIITVHTNWLNRVGMICNASKTELIAFGPQGVEIESRVKMSGDHLKELLFVQLL